MKGLNFHSCKLKNKPNCICIHRSTKPFYYYAANEKEFDKWLDYLERVGGKKISQESGDSQLAMKKGGNVFSSSSNVSSFQEDIEVKDVNQWTNQNVLEWMKIFTFTDQRTFAQAYGKIWREKKITGRELVNMQEDDLIELGISQADATQMMTAIEDLSVSRKFNKNEFILVQKIQKSASRSGSKSKNHNWMYLAKTLATEDGIKKTYLSPSPVHDQLEKHLDTGEEDEDENFEIVPEGTELNAVKSTEAKKIPVKLVVTEMNNSNTFKTFRKFLSPIMNSLPNLTHEFGIFHTAIIVGPWYLEWTDSAIVFPRKMYSSMALLSADLDSTTMKAMTLDQVSDKLAQVVIKWNVHKEYCNYALRGKKPNQGNCHDFVEDVLKALDIQIPTSGAFANFLKKMKENGQCEMEFSPSSEFKEQFQLTAPSYKFDTHKELDSFVQRLTQINELALTMDYAQEMMLLKSFDRAFWLRHLKHPHMDEYKPIGTDSPDYPHISDSEKCPFRDPTETKSYVLFV